MDDVTSRIYNEYRKHLLEGRDKSFDQFDKAILTLAGGGLAISLTFIDNIVPLSSATDIWALFFSWSLFTLSILITLISFISSQIAFDKQLELAEKYYVNNDENSYKQLNKPALLTKWLNIFSAVSFITAVLFLLFFVYINISSKEGSMGDKKRGNISEGTVPAKMTKIIPDKKGIVPSNIPLKPNQSSQDSSGNSSTGKK